MTLATVFFSILLLGAPQSATSPSQPAVAPDNLNSSPVDPITATRDGIVRVLREDDSVARVYFFRKQSADGTFVFVLVPIFDKKYPAAAIDAAMKVFEQHMPPGTPFELLLVPKREYKKYFSRIEPIYVRP